jgi:hypothetical protein
MKISKLLIIQQTCAEAAKVLQYPLPTQGIEESPGYTHYPQKGKSWILPLTLRESLMMKVIKTGADTKKRTYFYNSCLQHEIMTIIVEVNCTLPRHETFHKCS